MGDDKLGNARKKPLSQKEIAFYGHILNGKKRYEAYLEVYPNVTKETAMANGPRLYSRIKKKMDWDDATMAMDAQERLLKELIKRFDAKKVVYLSKGKGVFDKKTHPDETIRMRATELLADMIGKRRPTEGDNGGATIIIQPAEINKPANAGMSVQARG